MNGGVGIKIAYIMIPQDIYMICAVILFIIKNGYCRRI